MPGHKNREKNRKILIRERRKIEKAKEKKAKQNSVNMSEYMLPTGSNCQPSWLDSNGVLIKEVAKEFLRRILEGETVRRICEAPGMPSVSTIFRQVQRSSAFKELFFLARELASLKMEDDIQELVEELGGKGLRFDKNAAYVADIRIKALLNLMRIKNPKRYSDKFQLPDGLQGDVTIRFRTGDEGGREGELSRPSDNVIDVDPFDFS